MQRRHLAVAPRKLVEPGAGSVLVPPHLNRGGGRVAVERKRREGSQFLPYHKAIERQRKEKRVEAHPSCYRRGRQRDARLPDLLGNDTTTITISMVTATNSCSFGSTPEQRRKGNTRHLLDHCVVLCCYVLLCCVVFFFVLCRWMYLFKIDFEDLGEFHYFIKKFSNKITCLDD